MNLRTLLLLALFSLAPWVWAAEPAAQIDALHEVLIKAMKHGGTASERVGIVEKVVVDNFDFESIAKVSVGREWQKIGADGQKKIVDLLRQLSLATYADRFDSFENQKFVSEGEVKGKSGTVVKSHILRSNGEKVSLHYYFRNGRIFNVVADGVSDLALRRADYGSILRREGFPALLAHIERNIEELR